MKRALSHAAILSVILALGGPAAAWGPEGHAIIADIASAHLTPSAAAEVSRLLALENNHALDDVSSWADAWRAGHPETTQWHFVDIPLDAAGFDEARDCHYGQDDHPSAEASCVIAKIADFSAILADKHQSDQDRLVALKYLVHFIGDIHQPLHAEDKNHDRGGNLVKLRFHDRDTNLHALWDGGIIEAQFGWSLGPNYSFDHKIVAAEAALLDREITPSERSRWVSSIAPSSLKASAIAWADESHDLALDAYAKLPAKIEGDWESAYQSYAWPVIETQLKKGGVRLAAVLNAALAD